MSPSVTKLLDLIETGAVSAQNAPEAIRQAGGASLCLIEAVRALASAGGDDMPSGFATQEEAEEGESDTKVMSPLRTAQAIAALAGAGTLLAHVAFVDGSQGDDDTAVIGDASRPFQTAQAAWDAVYNDLGQGKVYLMTPGAYTLELTTANASVAGVHLTGLHHRLCSVAVTCRCPFSFSAWTGAYLTVYADGSAGSEGGGSGEDGFSLSFFDCVGDTISSVGGAGGGGWPGADAYDDGVGTLADGAPGGPGGDGGAGGSVTLARCVFQSISTAGGGAGGGGSGGAGVNGGSPGASGFPGNAGSYGNVTLYHSSVGYISAGTLSSGGSGCASNDSAAFDDLGGNMSSAYGEGL